jgi:hypothetical protein
MLVIIRCVDCYLIVLCEADGGASHQKTLLLYGSVTHKMLRMIALQEGCRDQIEARK